MMSGFSIALELIALALGALVILACHRNDVQRNVFAKFIGYFVVICSFVGLIVSIIACFIYWMNSNNTSMHRSDFYYEQQNLIKPSEEILDNNKIKDSAAPATPPTKNGVPLPAQP